jgi:hypothetical protein
MKVLMVSRYVEPKPVGGNSNVYRQVRSLCDDCGVDVEILTWPHNDLWTGPVPKGVVQDPPMRVEREGMIQPCETPQKTR